MTWTTHGWGTGSTPAPPAGYAFPYLVGSSPPNGSTNNAVNAEIAFEIEALADIDVSTLVVQINGVDALIGATFQSGFAGSITDAGALGYIISFTGYPAVTTFVDVVINVSDLDAAPTVLSFSYATNLGTISNLTAKTYCEGKRIDLAWTNPAAITRLKIRRSNFAYCRFVDDPGEDLYEGVAITTYSDTGLEEDKFYYYSIFVSFSGSPYEWIYSQDALVQGLSIKDYNTLFGRYVYELLPRTYRDRDADPARLTDRYLLRDYCDFLQCGVNTYRGWIEALIHLRDPDTMPSGRVGMAENQNGILEAQSWDLGMVAERSFDAAVLRRIALGIMPIHKKKGSCTALVDLTKLLTGWDGRCDEGIEPVCGNTRFATTWDGESFTVTWQHVLYADIPALVAGSITLPNNDEQMQNASGAAVEISDVAPLPGFVLDGLGTYACIGTVGAPGVTQLFTFENPSAKLRTEITGSGTGAAGLFTITSIDTSSYPWQFPAPTFAEPQFGDNAFASTTTHPFKLMDSTGALFPIVASVATASGDTVLTVTGTPATGVFSISTGFDPSGATYATRKPYLHVTFYVGEFSLTYDPKWDVRLNAETMEGPWSNTVSFGSPSALFFSPSPADVTIWANDVAEQVSLVTSVERNTLDDTSQGWTINQWRGYFVNPNWNQRKLYRIIGNTVNRLIVSVVEGGGINTVSAYGQRYVILSEQNALKYSRLVQVFPSFLPHESRGFVKFEPVDSVGGLAVAPSSIASAEAIGSPTLTVGDVDLILIGIASSQGFGSPTVEALDTDQDLEPTGIASAQAIGTPVITRGAVTVSPTGIASAETIGTPVVTRGAVTISPTGIATGQAIGSPTVTTTITIASLIAAGKLSIHFDAAVGVTKDGSDFVSNWENTGTGSDATQATGALQPTWYASQVNGLPAIGWNVSGASSKMPGTMASQTACTIIAVIKQDTTHDGWIIDLEPTNTTTQEGVMLVCTVGGNNAMRAVTSDATKASVNATWQILSGSTTDALRRIWNNQVLGTNNSTGVTIGACDNFQLGSDVQFGIYFDGMLAEVIVSNVELTDEERTAVEDELQAKYAL